MLLNNLARNVRRARLRGTKHSSSYSPTLLSSALPGKQADRGLDERFSTIWLLLHASAPLHAGHRGLRGKEEELALGLASTSLGGAPTLTAVRLLGRLYPQASPEGAEH